MRRADPTRAGLANGRPDCQGRGRARAGVCWAVGPCSRCPMELRCPACKHAVLNRRLATCEFCGKPLPAELRMSAAEKQDRTREFEAKERLFWEQQAREREEHR